ncbi:MAG: deoxyguanosinetriphosphate triphosphohydrolase [Desulfuromonadales bacterium]|nr:deoxyguanosinetriphosphate triphosphohydrolase [Desulfuromonadales bacterium]MDW7756212.1 deoxyguanosinetriphosphate triphosphohydrolase [Desulfuromonadales bacterium]
MTIREQLEHQEELSLSPKACLSMRGGQRKKEEDPCAVRTAFQHDRDRILHCKSFRRLKHKTQVFLAPEGDHYRTRLTHTLEVAQIARTVAKALRLNEDLTEAIALGHDLGHTPFGHAGERVLSELVSGGFHHVRQSLRVVDCLEKEGLGLNLTAEVRDGIVKHSKGRGAILAKDPAVRAETLEGQVVRLADIVAYVNHDLDDALRAGLIRAEQVPAAIVDVLGRSHSQRINTMVCDMIQASIGSDEEEISLSPAVIKAIDALREWLFVHVYQVKTVHDDFIKASRILRELFLYFMQDEEALVAHGGDRFCGDSLEVSVADFIAGMTDRFAINLYHRLFLPQPWKIL